MPAPSTDQEVPNVFFTQTQSIYTNSDADLQKIIFKSYFGLTKHRCGWYYYKPSG